MVNRLLDFRSHLHQVETPVPWLVFVTVPVAELAWTLAGVLFDVPPVYSSGWTPYVLLVRPDLSTLYPAKQRKPLLHRLYETGRVRCIFHLKLQVIGRSRTDFVHLYRGRVSWHQAKIHVSQTGCHRFWMGFLVAGRYRPAVRLFD